MKAERSLIGVGMGVGFGICGALGYLGDLCDYYAFDQDNLWKAKVRALSGYQGDRETLLRNQQIIREWMSEFYDTFGEFKEQVPSALRELDRNDRICTAGRIWKQEAIQKEIWNYLSELNEVRKYPSDNADPLIEKPTSIADPLEQGPAARNKQKIWEAENEKVRVEKVRICGF